MKFKTKTLIGAILCTILIGCNNQYVLVDQNKVEQFRTTLHQQRNPFEGHERWFPAQTNTIHSENVVDVDVLKKAFNNENNPHKADITKSGLIIEDISDAPSTNVTYDWVIDMGTGKWYWAPVHYTPCLNVD